MPTLGYASYLLDIIGTVAFAVAGAMVAVSRRMDLFGVLSMGAVTAMGGGVIRDVLLGQFRPVLSITIRIFIFRWRRRWWFFWRCRFFGTLTAAAISR